MSEPDLPTRTVLIVDDSDADRHAVRRYLQRDPDHRYVFLEAVSGEDGLRLARAHRPDCILIDHHLPDMTGLEFLATWTGAADAEPLPIVMLTGSGDETIAVAALKGGAQDYLVKGRLSLETLHIAINGSIGRMQLLKTLESQRRDLERQNAELQARQREIEALNERLRRAMAETHHRVKNNLQVISAMIEMQLLEYRQSGSIPLQELNTFKTHVQTLSTVHHLLTDSVRETEDVQRLSVRPVLDQLLPMLQRTTSGQSLSFTIADADLTAKQCIALSLIVNELVTNALKHGRETCQVVFEVEEASARLEVLDDGPGFPETFDPLVDSHLGLELVESLIQTDLRGRSAYRTLPEGGGQVLVTLPLPPRL